MRVKTIGRVRCQVLTLPPVVAYMEVWFTGLAEDRNMGRTGVNGVHVK